MYAGRIPPDPPELAFEALEALRERLPRASERTLRDFTLACIEVSVAAAPLGDAAADSARQLLAQRAAYPSRVRDDLAALQARLEEESLEAEAAHARGAMGADAMLERFNRARAATALELAFRADRLAAATQVLEEAATIFADRPEVLVAAVQSVLDADDGDGFRADRPVRVRRAQWFDDLAPVVRTLPDATLRSLSTAAVQVLHRRFRGADKRLQRALRALEDGDFGDTRTRRQLMKLIPEAPADASTPQAPTAALAWATWNALDPVPFNAAIRTLLAAYNALGEDDADLAQELAAREIIVIS